MFCRMACADPEPLKCFLYSVYMGPELTAFLRTVDENIGDLLETSLSGFLKYWFNTVHVVKETDEDIIHLFAGVCWVFLEASETMTKMADTLLDYYKNFLQDYAAAKGFEMAPDLLSDLHVNCVTGYGMDKLAYSPKCWVKATLHFPPEVIAKVDALVPSGHEFVQTTALEVAAFLHAECFCKRVNRKAPGVTLKVVYRYEKLLSNPDAVDFHKLLMEREITEAINADPRIHGALEGLQLFTIKMERLFSFSM